MAPHLGSGGERPGSCLPGNALGKELQWLRVCQKGNLETNAYGALMLCKLLLLCQNRASRSTCWLSTDDMQVVAGRLNRESKGIEQGIYRHMFVKH